MSRPVVAYVDYDPNYPTVFEQTERLVHSALPGQRLEHIGSTSVPGLGGRGVLDTAVVAPTGEHPSVVEALKHVGFSDFPYGAVQPGLAIDVALAERAYPVVLYVVADDHEYLRGWLAFTRYMQAHPEQVERYSQVKRAALAEGKTDASAYQEAKTPYLVELAQMVEADPRR